MHVYDLYRVYRFNHSILRNSLRIVKLRNTLYVEISLRYFAEYLSVSWPRRQQAILCTPSCFQSNIYQHCLPSAASGNRAVIIWRYMHKWSLFAVADVIPVLFIPKPITVDLFLYYIHFCGIEMFLSLFFDVYNYISIFVAVISYLPRYLIMTTYARILYFFRDILCINKQ